MTTFPFPSSGASAWRVGSSLSDSRSRSWGDQEVPMRVIDVDAHLHEPLDWVEQVDGELAEALGPPARFMDSAGAISGWSEAASAPPPGTQHPKGEFDTTPPGFIRHLQITDTLQPDSQSASAGNPFSDAGARLRYCDEKGIGIQFLNPTCLVGPFVQAARAKRMDLMPRIRQAWNRWSSQQVAGHTDRLMPVVQIDMNDVEWSIAQMTEMRQAGSRAFAIPEAPVRNTMAASTPGGRPMGKSITHPDFEPLWAAAEDLGMAAFAHVGLARERINTGWANNGADDLMTFSLLNMIVNPQSGPQLLIGAMVFDGVFERHPNITVVVEEVGINWLPHLLSALDHAVGR